MPLSNLIDTRIFVWEKWLVYVSCELNVYVVLVQLSEVLDSKAWAMTMMLKGGRYPSDGNTKLNLIIKKLTIKGNVD